MASSHKPKHSSSASPSAGIGDLSDAEFKERALFAIEHQLRPAEEVEAVRRAMADNLARALGQEQLTNPLTLVDADATPPHPLEEEEEDIILSPAQREFVEAVRKNLELRAGFAEAQETHRATTTQQQQQQTRDTGVEAEVQANEAELLRLQLRMAGLQDRVDRHRAALRRLDELRRQPAAAPDFLDPAAMFQDCDPLPEMPRELMDSFTFDRGAAADEAQARFQRLKRESLRQQLQARQKEQRLAAARARYSESPRDAPPEVQLHALHAVKDALIAWIEEHLSRAGDGHEDSQSVAGSPEKKKKKASPGTEEHDYEAQLAEIQREYDRHIELRKEVLGLITYHEKKTDEWSRILSEEQERENDKKKEEGTDGRKKGKEARSSSPTTTAAPNASLITPYIEKLQAIAREQKGLVQEKSHINATLARHQQDTRELLGHMAEESQLLAKFPNGKQQSSDFGEATKGAAAKQVSLASLLEPWLVAADAAKLSTLETVAEKVEEGQMAVDEAMAALDEARKVLNGEDNDAEATGEQDGAKEGTETAGGKKNVDKGKSIYAKLDGNLGLINE